MASPPDDAAGLAEQSDDDEIAELLAAAGLSSAGSANPRRRAWERAEEFWLWPENVPVLLLWGAVRTQWRTGPMGAVGLDYRAVDEQAAQVLRPHLRGLGRRVARLQALRWACDGVRLMERHTLDVWAELRERNAAKRKHK